MRLLDDQDTKHLITSEPIGPSNSVEEGNISAPLASLSNLVHRYSDLFRLHSRLNSRNLLIDLQDIRLRPKRRNRKLVDLLVALGVVILDVCELGRGPEGIVPPVAVSQPSTNRQHSSLTDLHDEGEVLLMERRIPATDVSDIALEVLYIDDVKADNSLFPLVIRYRPMSAKLRTVNSLTSASVTLSP